MKDNDQRFDRKWALLMNTETGRWHPVEFYACPLPSDPGFTIPRHYSMGHHTDGAVTRDQATLYIQELAKIPGVSDCSEYVFAWDGGPLSGLCAYMVPKPKKELATCS